MEAKNPGDQTGGRGGGNDNGNAIDVSSYGELLKAVSTKEANAAAARAADNGALLGAARPLFPPPQCYQSFDYFSPHGTLSNLGPQISTFCPVSTTGWRSHIMSPFPQNAFSACNTGPIQGFDPFPPKGFGMFRNLNCPSTNMEGSVGYYANRNSNYIDSAFLPSSRVVPNALSSAPIPVVSSVSKFNNLLNFFEEDMSHTKEAKDSEGAMIQCGTTSCKDVITRDSDQHVSFQVFPEQTTQTSAETMSCDCGGLQVVIRKELTNSDVGNIGRIVLPKKDAEANLPKLLERDGMILSMDDLMLARSWKFKYRFWPNNKSRMYVLEATGEFVKTHRLQTGDTLLIYRSLASGNYVVRGEKNVKRLTSPRPCKCESADPGND